MMPRDLDPVRDLGLRKEVVFAATDVADFWEVGMAARAVVERCVDGRGEGQGGWWSIGQKGGVGLFVWATGSEIDRRVHGFQLGMRLGSSERGLDKGRGADIA